jgi:hypothetical protein
METGEASSSAGQGTSTTSETAVASSSSPPPHPPLSSSSSHQSPPSASTLTTDSQRIAEAKAAVTASLESVIAPIDADLKQRAIDLHANAAAIARQEAMIKQETEGLAKQTAKWNKELEVGSRKLKELGDAQNWAELLERDLLVLEEVVRLKEGRVDEGRDSASGTNRPLNGPER